MKGKRGPRPRAAKAKPQRPPKKLVTQPQGELIQVEEASRPSVQGEKMLVKFVKPTFDKTRDGKPTIALAFSLPITKEHEALLPTPVEEGWRFMAKHGRKRLDLNGVPGQHAKLYLADDMAEPAVVLPAAKVEHVSLQSVQQKGSGKEEQVIRLSFRLRVPVSHEVARFAEWNFGNAIWLELHETQEALFDDEEE